MVAQLRTKGFVERGKLGLAFQPVTAAIATAVGLDRPRGAMVSEIMRGSAAQKAGIKSGDIILSVNKTDINRAEELPRNVARHAPGSTISVELLRNGKRKRVSARLDKLERERNAAAEPRPRNSGGSSSSGTRTGALGIDMSDHPEGGARVTAITKPIDGLMVGDHVVELNGRAIRDSADLQKRLSTSKRTDTVLLKVLRRGRPRYVGISIGS